MSKVYAVRKGVIPGLYFTWKECEAQIKGFSGAIFKSFPNEKEAQKYLNIETKTVSTKKDYDITIDIYTDGSRQRSKDYLGLGAYCLFEGIEYKMSKECTPDFLAKYEITETTCSNPTAEFCALAEVLKEFEGFQSPYSIKLNIYSDYLGVKCWTIGEWKPKVSYIRKIRDKCLAMIKTMSCDVEIFHIKGHSNIYENDHADVCAKDLKEYNTFPNLLKLLNAI